MLLPNRGTVLAHLVRVENYSDTKTSKNYDGSWTNTAPWWALIEIGKHSMCSGPKQGLTLPASVDLEETVITGRVVDGDGRPWAARSCGCWTPSDRVHRGGRRVGHRHSGSSPRGSWTLRALSAAGSGDAVNCNPRTQASRVGVRHLMS